ncbi:MAG: hypothetical protein DMF85_08580 [Acidobacteria bacterium]|nr:MAG: hypothetical protein DMF85_08580 [Acidobacteriota bacterium]
MARGAVSARCFTIGVFQNAADAARGLEALTRHGFPAEAVTLMGKDSPDLRQLIQKHVQGPRPIEAAGLDGVVGAGALLETLQGDDRRLTTDGLAATIGRAGFQRHDGQIFERLVARGGVLVAIHSLPRAADALATLHAYGGGNAAIGAWAGRV